jgi:hypothetical protein
MPNCRRLLLQAADLAASFARLSAGNNIAARMAMTAITTNSSIRVNALHPEQIARFKLLCGFRRWRISRLLGLSVRRLIPLREFAANFMTQDISPRSFRKSTAGIFELRAGNVLS